MLAARVTGAHTGVFSEERVYVHRLDTPTFIPKPKKTNLKRRLLPFAAVFIALLCQLAVRIQIIHAGYALHRHRTNALAFDGELRSLNAELAELTAPKKILTRAQKELGLSLTPGQRIRVVEVE